SAPWESSLTRLQALGMQANPGQALDPLRLVIFGHQLGPFPHPAHGIEPVPYSPSGNLQAVFRLELGSQRGTTLMHPAPAIGPWRSLEECPQRALDPGQQDHGPDGREQLALCVDCAAHLASAIEAHNPIDTGARAEQES